MKPTRIGKFLLSVLPVGQAFGWVGVAKFGNGREACQTLPRCTREAAMEAIRRWAERKCKAVEQ